MKRFMLHVAFVAFLWDLRTWHTFGTHFRFKVASCFHLILTAPQAFFNHVLPRHVCLRLGTLQICWRYFNAILIGMIHSIWVFLKHVIYHIAAIHAILPSPKVWNLRSVRPFICPLLARGLAQQVGLRPKHEAQIQKILDLKYRQWKIL